MKLKSFQFNFGDYAKDDLCRIGGKFRKTFRGQSCLKKLGILLIGEQHEQFSGR
jgi:hypothetical protein